MSVKDAKLNDLSKDTVDINTKNHMTTDYGIKIENPDNWLRAVDGNQTGPSLLEDQIAREKVCIFRSLNWDRGSLYSRLCDSTMNGFPNVSSMPVAQELLALSNFTRVPRPTPLQAS